MLGVSSSSSFQSSAAGNRIQADDEKEEDHETLLQRRTPHGISTLISLEAAKLDVACVVFFPLKCLVSRLFLSFFVLRPQGLSLSWISARRINLGSRVVLSSSDLSVH